MASPKPSASPSPTTSSQLHSKTDSSGIGTTVFSSNINLNNAANNHNNNNTNLQHLRSPAPTPGTTCLTNSSSAATTSNVFSPTTNPMNNVFSQAGTPSDTTSSLSSFTSTGGHPMLMSPESIDSVMLTMSPVDSCRTGIVGKTSTFKAQQNRKSMDLEAMTSFTTSQLGNGVDCNEVNLRKGVQRPTPPSTLNLGPLRYVFLLLCLIF